MELWCYLLGTARFIRWRSSILHLSTWWKKTWGWVSSLWSWLAFQMRVASLLDATSLNCCPVVTMDGVKTLGWVDCYLMFKAMFGVSCEIHDESIWFCIYFPVDWMQEFKTNYHNINNLLLFPCPVHSISFRLIPHIMFFLTLSALKTTYLPILTYKFVLKKCSRFIVHKEFT